jgi:ubiquinone/menaquinone biosynthesis C-methylase UbiE
LKLNWLGRRAMNGAPRRLLQERYVARSLERLGGRVEGGRVLEVGCGGGAGAALILRRFGAREICAFDLDLRMIRVARRRLAGVSDRVALLVGDATRLAARPAAFDAVFDFGAIHLLPEWRAAVAEVARVLKPAGRFYFELVTRPWLRLSYPLFVEGEGGRRAPAPPDFLRELARQGLAVRALKRPRWMPLSGLVGDLLGVAERSA